VGALWFLELAEEQYVKSWAYGAVYWLTLFQLYAPLQGVLSDKRNTQIGYWVAFAGYINALAYGVGMCIDKERRKRIDSKTGRRFDDVPQPTYVEDGSEKSGIEKF
jgi:hypothetical protein